MNPPTSTEPPLPALQPPQPPQAHRPSTSCDRHPDEKFTGFCPSCLSERLSLLDPNTTTITTTTTVPSSSRFRPPTSSTATAALKSIFKPSKTTSCNKPSCSTSSSLFPELRRTKSFSASKNKEGFGLGFSGVFEPQRKSCDVRGVRNTLSSLFSLDDDNRTHSSSELNTGLELPHRISVSSSVQYPVFESKDEGEDECEIEEVVGDDGNGNHEDYIEVLDDRVSEEKAPEIVEEEAVAVRVLETEFIEEEVKTMKDHIDLDLQIKKSAGRDFKDIAGSFWSAASVFSKKLQRWRHKQKAKKTRNGSGSATLPVEKSITRQMRETQSEVADYGYGRRSCDTAPRFSLDAGRMSFDAARMSFDEARISFDAPRMSLDDPRYSFDEARASWDGYSVGRSAPHRMPTMLSVVEDAPLHVLRSDTQIPIEEAPMNSIDEDETVPGGTTQTWDYYSDSSSRRRKSLDRSSSIRKTAASAVADIDEMKPTPCANSKVSPTTTDYLHEPKVVVPDRETNSNYSTFIRCDPSEGLEVGFKYNASVIGNGERRAPLKKSWRWSKAWSIWGFINRKGGNKENDDRCSRANGVERSFSESWRDIRGDHSSIARGNFNKKVYRSNSSVSWRNSGSFGGGSSRRNGYEANGDGRKRMDEFVLERNCSARYSPNNVDHLTPMRNSRRNGSVKSRSSQAHSFARSVFRLY